MSVLIPCHNAEKYVGEAIDSALAQTYPNVEVVVVDDGSSDGSVEVIRRFGARIVAEFGPNRGACAARNRALALSRGEYIQFLDADDLLLPHKVERQLPLLERGEADLVSCRGYMFGAGTPDKPKRRPVRPPDGTDPFAYCLGNGLATEGPLIRRSLVERVGGFNPALRRAQEFEFHVRLAAAGARIAFLDDLLYRHRDHDGPRITRTPQSVDTTLRMLLGVADAVRGPEYQMVPARWAALAGAIHQHAIYAYRNGATAAAAEGFARARSLSTTFDYAERRWYKAGTRLVGPVNMERGLAVGRRLLRRRTGGE